MTEHATIDAYGVLTEPATLRMQRLLPGPAERIWAYITESDKRRQWLAAGEMVLEVGAEFEFVWRNEELAGEQGKRPEGWDEEHRLTSRITEVEPPRKLSFTWGSTGGVSLELEPRGKDVLLTVTHHRVLDRSMLLSVSAGWHSHLDILDAIVRGTTPKAFWPNYAARKAVYEDRFKA